MASVRRMFAYIFEPPEQQGGGLPQLVPFRIAGPFTLGGVEIVPVPVFHGRLPVLGFRIGSFAYLTDCNRIPDESWPLLEGVRTVVLDALRAPAALDAFQRRPGGRGRRAARRRARVLHAHLPRSARMPRPARACRPAWNWLMMAWCLEIHVT